METCKNVKKILRKYKSCLYVFVILLIFFIGCFLQRENLKIIYLFLADDKHKNLELIGMAGGFILFISSLWTYYNFKRKEQNDFLILNIDVQYSDRSSSDILIKTKVTNNVNTFKKVKFACLVMSKFYDTSLNHENKQGGDNKIASLDNEFETDFLKKITSLTGCTTKVQYTNDIVTLRDFPALFDPTRDIAFLPLPFYYKENIRFGNEEVSYTFLLDLNEIKLSAGKYSVRFFVFRKDKGFHRCVHDVFTVG